MIKLRISEITVKPVPKSKISNKVDIGPLNANGSDLSNIPTSFTSIPNASISFRLDKRAKIVAHYNAQANLTVVGSVSVVPNINGSTSGPRFIYFQQNAVASQHFTGARTHVFTLDPGLHQVTLQASASQATGMNVFGANLVLYFFEA